MRKIPTLFVRDPDTGLRYVTTEVHPDCQWVMDGEGVPTRKYDGTCVMFDGKQWWGRREVKAGKPLPAGYVIVQADDVTGKSVGWEPIGRSAFAKFHAEAIAGITGSRVGTYELVGPKINGNPEHADHHQLWAHATAEGMFVAGLTFELVRYSVLAARDVDGCEGIVWHHEDGRMAKIKAKDFASVPVAAAPPVVTSTSMVDFLPGGGLR